MKGILLVNLGSPKSPSEEDVRIYLREFLMDKYVIDVPWALRKLIVEGAILPSRPKESAHAYQSIWEEEGSPLIVISKKLLEKVRTLVDYPVSLAMRYQEPSLQEGLQELYNQGVTETFVIPLYPQYAMSTTLTVEDKTIEVRKKHFRNMNIKFLSPFYNDPGYIEVLSKHIKSHLPNDFDLLLFSYHGIPEKHIIKTDETKTCKINDICCITDNLPSHNVCYRHQCYYVTEKIKEQLKLSDDKIKLTFQSRLGKDPWLQPYTDQFLQEAGKNNIKKLVVTAPAFVADCLETLEELAIRGKDTFLKNGGEEFIYIPCLNDTELWSKWLASVINKNL